MVMEREIDTKRKRKGGCVLVILMEREITRRRRRSDCVSVIQT